METLRIAVLFLSLCCLWRQGYGVQRDSLYPFGEFQGDQRLSIGDDISSSEIQLTTPIAFYDGTYRSVYINLNGHLSFETEIPVYKSDLILPIGFKVIAPFFADIDTRLSGNVYYRETQDPSLLEMGTREIQRNFPGAIGFGAQSLLLVTWDDVGYYKEQYDKTNTFQVVIASDGFDSYTFYHYVDDGLAWVKSQGKSAPIHEDVPAQAGFDAGDHRRSYSLPGSGRPEVQNLAVWSNINVPGAWLFHIGLLEGSDIELPPSTDSVSQSTPDSHMACSGGGAQMCNSDAECVDKSTGFCCQCKSGYFGNGFNCLQTGTPQRVNGRVSGTVNSVVIPPVILHSYVVTSDGRAYTAISQLPGKIGNSLQSVFTLGGVMGWLFALPSTPKSQNGYSLTGGDFNRTAVLTFVSGGETLHIDEQFEGAGPNGYMRATMRVNGNVPTVAENAKVTVDDYKEEYKRTGPGVIQVHSTHTYRVEGVPHRFKLDQTIKYKECAAAPPTVDTQRLAVKRNFITFDQRENVVRYAQTNRVTASVGGTVTDPCTGNTCGPNSQCVAAATGYQCRCNRGYQGDGKSRPCADVDECRTDANDCDFNARCYNTEGSFECRCNPGYRGDGRTCQRDLTCADVTCDVNARCVYDSDIGQPACECNSGYLGDGATCQAVEFSCNEVSNCGENAECLYDSASGKYKCECVDGFSGDGFSCTDTGERSTTTQSRAATVKPILTTTPRADCSVLRNCDVNAQCVYDDRIDEYRCVCSRGYRGDGYRCAAEDDCRVTNVCDFNAQCVFDPDHRRYSCQCNVGFEGDGRYCQQKVIACNQVNNCDVNAECLYDDVTLAFTCRCRAGFEGDGISCVASNDCSRDAAICDVNARCLRQGNTMVCSCNQGYRGDGRRCAPTGDTNSYLMFAQGMSIMEVPFVPTDTNPGKQTLLIPGQTAIGIDVDCYSRYFYWTDISGKAISRARLDGTDSEALVTGLGSPEGVAVDWVARNMYWTDSGLDRIEVSKVDGTNRKTLFNTNMVNPRAITVDPGNGLMFWSDWDRKAPKIEAAHMDGSGRRTLVSADLGLPNGLAIDHRARQVCWADAGTMHIECINYDGRARRTVYALASYPFDLTLHNDIFYWTDWDMKSLPSIDKFGGPVKDPIKLPVGGNGKLYGITSVRDRCPGGSNACVLNNGGCRFLCLPTPNGGRTCACPDDIEEGECNRINLLK